MRAAVTEVVDECVACTRAKSFESARDLPLSSVCSSSPFNAVAVDLYSPGKVSPSGEKYVLTIVDLCTRWVTVCAGFVQVTLGDSDGPLSDVVPFSRFSGIHIVQ